MSQADIRSDQTATINTRAAAVLGDTFEIPEVPNDGHCQYHSIIATFRSVGFNLSRFEISADIDN
eukprot:1757010-Pleurochrysis_carterae.AAC.1